MKEECSPDDDEIHATGDDAHTDDVIQTGVGDIQTTTVTTAKFVQATTIFLLTESGTHRRTGSVHRF